MRREWPLRKHAFRDNTGLPPYCNSDLQCRTRVSSADEPVFGRRPIPAALVCAGGVNAADHAQTFPTLADVLRKQVLTAC